VRDWLKELSSEDRKHIGEDIKTVEFGWPIGMPVCRPLGGVSTKYGRAWPKTESHACFSTLTRKAGWSCSMDSLRKRRRRPARI
jgi:hypothetical protein